MTNVSFLYISLSVQVYAQKHPHDLPSTLNWEASVGKKESILATEYRKTIWFVATPNPDEHKDKHNKRKALRTAKHNSGTTTGHITMQHFVVYIRFLLTFHCLKGG